MVFTLNNIKNDFGLHSAWCFCVGKHGCHTFTNAQSVSRNLFVQILPPGTGDENEFELLSSLNKKHSETSSPTSSAHLVQQQTMAEEEKGSKVSTETVVYETRPEQHESSLSDYLPHISVGVAAAAACIGFYILKKS